MYTAAVDDIEEEMRPCEVAVAASPAVRKRRGLASAARTAARALADVFLPRFCIVCGRLVPCESEADVCDECRMQIALPEGHYCAKCGAPMARYAAKCPNCRNMSLAMDAATAFGFYTEPLRERLIDFKFNGKQYLARTFGMLVAGAVRRSWLDAAFDAVVGVPLHRGRRNNRGFDQGQILAQYTAGALGIVHRPGLLKRARATRSQVGLSKTARMRNVKGAFKAAPGGNLETVLLVDDIMTTGATLSEAARALKRAGVGSVYGAVVARAGFEYNAPGSSPPDDEEESFE
ncbi:MAG: ComF family protein [Planctomycetes bacterium]|nr:ComF family protein [Planctomycetota bacterium]